jgi:hypothetical protein
MRFQAQRRPKVSRRSLRVLCRALSRSATSGYSHILAQEGSHGFTLLHKPSSAEELMRVLRRAIIAG